MIRMFFWGVKIIKCFKRAIFTFVIKMRVREYGKKLAVNHFSSMGKNVSLGDYCNFNGMRVTGAGKVVIGNYFHSGNNCWISTQDHNYDSGTKIPYDETYITKEVSIGDFVWLGSNVTVLGNVTIGDGAVIATGAVVTKNVPYCAVVGGNPAKILKYRDIVHFERLKSLKAFH